MILTAPRSTAKVTPGARQCPRSVENKRDFMRLFRVQIKNYRNFELVNCRLDRHVVLIGENGSGKTNLLQAIRLVLDATMSDAERLLESEDFWSGIEPFCGNEITVTIDLTEFDHEPAVLACLQDYEIQAPSDWSSPVARLTYRYAPKERLDFVDPKSLGRHEYTALIYGKDDPSNEVGYSIRKYIYFRVLHALRDAEGDLKSA